MCQGKKPLSVPFVHGTLLIKNVAAADQDAAVFGAGIERAKKGRKRLQLSLPFS